MAITRVNTTSLNANSTAASGYSVTIPSGTGILAGDLLIVCTASDGTHVNNGMAVQDSVNTTNFTTIPNNVQQGSASTHWMQNFYYQTPQAIADGATITFTPSAASTHNAFAVDIFRGTAGAITQTATSSSNTAGTSQAALALGAAPRPGDLVLTFDAATSGTLTPGAAFTAGSSNATSQSAAIGYVIAASGLSTYASTWTDTSSQTSATQTVSFGSAQINAAYLIAANAFASGTTSTAVTVGAASGSLSSQVGDAIFVIASVGSGSVTPATVTDSHSQSYVQVGSVTPSNGLCSYLYALYNSGSALLSSGPDTVTVTWSGTANNKSVMVVGCDNVATTAALDQEATANGSGTGPSVTTANSLSSGGELALTVVMGGSASSSTAFASPWNQFGSTLQTGGGVYTSVAWQVPSSTTAVNATATLGASAVWSALVATFSPAAIGGAIPGSSPVISTTSPLPGGTIGVAYSDQLTATGGTPPYLWDNSAGTPPAGLTLSHGTKGGTSAIGAAGFSAGAPGTTGVTESDWAAGYRKFLGNPPATNAGQGLFVKLFFHLGLPATWAATSGSTAPAVDIANAFPGVFPMICWNNAPSASGSEITAFCNSIPAGQLCAFSYISEQEADGIAASAFQGNWKIIYQAVHASKNAANLMVATSSYMPYYMGATATSKAFLPAPNVCDGYGADEYYHLGSPPATGIQDDAKFQNWLTLAKQVSGGARPFGLTEYGIDVTKSDAATRDKYLANDIKWINAQFNNPSGVSGAPMFGAMYWDRWTKSPNPPQYGPLTDATAVSLWGNFINSAGGGGSGSSGGLLSGIPTAAGTTSATYRVTDASNVATTKSLAVTIATANTLVVATQNPLPGGTVGTAYSVALVASGGTPPYSWTTTVGAPTAGVSLSAAGLLSGTPTNAGTTTATYQVTDSAALTASAALSTTVSAGVTITTTTLPGATSGVAYTATLVATGGTAPYNWGIIAGAIPDGLTLDGVAGVISGTATGTSGSFTVQVQDSAGAFASQQLTINVTGVTSSGVGRRRFGGGIADYTITASGSSISLSDSATVIFFDSLTGGNQYTDLTDTSGNSVTSVTSDANGEIPEFFGPSGVWKMAADGNGGNGPRRWMMATDMGDEVSALVSGQSSGLNPIAGLVPGGVPVWNGTTWQNQLIADASVDPAAGIQVSKLQAGGNQADLLTIGATPTWVSPAQGTVTLNGTTAVVVPAVAVTANSRIFLQIQSPGGTPGAPYVSARSAGVSFSVKSSAGDTSVCGWFILEPGT